MNENLKKLIKRFEGCSLIPYRCPAGAKTIGWGHNIDAHGLPSGMDSHVILNGSITREMAEQLLEDDISNAIRDAKKLYPKFDTFSENRRNALTDMAFNMGLTTLSKFRISNRFVNDEKWQEAADNFMQSKWARQVKGRSTTICDLLRYG